MDMNWVDEIRDPEPRKRYIYNAADYDTQHGNPYYREYNTDPDSFWHQYESTAAFVSPTQFADLVEETRQADYEREIRQLTDYFGIAGSSHLADKNPLGDGGPLIVSGELGRHNGYRLLDNGIAEMLHGWGWKNPALLRDSEISSAWDENGRLFITGHPDAGEVRVEVRQLTGSGTQALVDFSHAKKGEPWYVGGRLYEGGAESVNRFWKDLTTDRHLSVEPRYLEMAFGRPPAEWDLDARVKDFAERMSDEYNSLYEKDLTGIKSSDDFGRFGAFVDNHLDFVRALAKARGELVGLAVDPISSDREIGAFLNTFDKLASMPEPSPAAQEKNELSAGVCDPADPTMGCLQDSPAAVR